MIAIITRLLTTAGLLGALAYAPALSPAGAAPAPAGLSAPAR